MTTNIFFKKQAGWNWNVTAANQDEVGSVETFGSRAISRGVFLFLDLLKIICLRLKRDPFLRWHQSFLEVEFQSFIYLFIWDYGSPLKRAIFCQQIRTDSGRSTWRGTHVLYIHENRGGGEKSTRREVIFHLMGVKALGKVGSCRPVHQSIQSTWRLRQKPSSLTWKGTLAFPRRQKKPLFAISSVEKIRVELYQHLLQNRNHLDVAQVPGSLRLGRWLKFSRRNLKLDKNKTWSFKEVKNQKPNQWWVKSSSDGWRDGWVVGVCLCV